MPRRILVTGANGNIGSILVPALAASPDVSVRAMVRDLAKAEVPAGVEVVSATFADAALLAAACAEIDVVVLIAPPGPGCVAQNQAVLAAAKEAGVRKIVRISAIKAAKDGRTENTRLHGECDRLLQESGLDFVILRPNYFMQNIFMVLDSIRGGDGFSAGMGDGRLAMIDVRDVADAAVAAATGDDFDNEAFELSGPASISFHDVATVLSEVAGRPIAYVAVTPDQVRESLLSYGFDPWMAELLREYSAAYGDGWGDLVTANVEKLTGRAPRSFRQFASEVLGGALG